MNTPTCPNCGKTMKPVYIIMSGGVWLSESRDRFEGVFDLDDTVDAQDGQEEESPLVQVPRCGDTPPLYCVIGSGGHRLGDWPKDGFYCDGCLCFFVKPKPD